MTSLIPRSFTDPCSYRDFQTLHIGKMKVTINNTEPPTLDTYERQYTMLDRIARICENMIEKNLKTEGYHISLQKLIRKIRHITKNEENQLNGKELNLYVMNMHLTVSVPLISGNQRVVCFIQKQIFELMQNILLRKKEIEPFDTVEEDENEFDFSKLEQELELAGLDEEEEEPKITYYLPPISNEEQILNEIERKTIEPKKPLFRLSLDFPLNSRTKTKKQSSPSIDPSIYIANKPIIRPVFQIKRPSKEALFITNFVHEYIHTSRKNPEDFIQEIQSQITYPKWLFDNNVLSFLYDSIARRRELKAQSYEQGIEFDLEASFLMIEWKKLIEEGLPAEQVQKIRDYIEPYINLEKGESIKNFLLGIYESIDDQSDDFLIVGNSVLECVRNAIETKRMTAFPVQKEKIKESLSDYSRLLDDALFYNDLEEAIQHFNKNEPSTKEIIQKVRKYLEPYSLIAKQQNVEKFIDEQYVDIERVLPHSLIDRKTLSFIVQLLIEPGLFKLQAQEIINLNVFEEIYQKFASYIKENIGQDPLYVQIQRNAKQHYPSATLFDKENVLIAIRAYIEEGIKIFNTVHDIVLDPDSNMDDFFHMRKKLQDSLSFDFPSHLLKPLIGKEIKILKGPDLLRELILISREVRDQAYLVKTTHFGKNFSKYILANNNHKKDSSNGDTSLS